MSTMLPMNAELSDEPRIESFLMINPSAAAIRKFLSEPAEQVPRSGSFYDVNARTASFVTLAGGRAFIIMLLNVTHNAVEAIKGRLDDTATMVLPAFQDIVEDVLSESINPEHPKGTYIARWWTATDMAVPGDHTRPMKHF